VGGLRVHVSSGERMMHREAAFSPPPQTYRYCLVRTWNEKLPVMGVIMLNPSTADARRDDPTIKRCITRAAKEGFGSLVVVNIFAYRSTDPERLMMVPNPVGPDNDAFIRGMLDSCEVIIAAWGTGGSYLGRDKEVLAMARESNHPLWCLGKTKDGYPRHPLYVRSDKTLEAFGWKVK
jgi:hypothetical protein